MIIRKMQVEERRERIGGTTFDLRQNNHRTTSEPDAKDDYFTVYVPAHAVQPTWVPGSYVTVSIVAEGE